MGCALLLAMLQLAATGWGQSAPTSQIAPNAYPRASQVDPWIGVDGLGETLPGPSLPFGMVKPGPDVGWNASNSGWESTGPINGFSQTHVSGTGGGPKYGNVLVQATVGAPQSGDYGSDRENERSSVGFYGVGLRRYGVQVELTAARRTALYRFTYPASGQANLLFDMGHCLTRHRKQFPRLGPLRDLAESLTDKIVDKLYRVGEAQSVTASEVKLVSPREVSGYTSVTGGWNQQSNSYTVYFYAISDTAAKQWGTWQGSSLHRWGVYERAGSGGKTGAWLSFPTAQGQRVSLKVAISFVSVEQARQTALGEIPDFDFERVHAQAAAAWERALEPVEIEGASAEQRRLFYTSLYHSMLMPVDRSGENPLWQSSEPYYDDYYSIWDTFRTTNPLLTLVAPERESGILRSLVDIYRHEGWLPDARSGNFTGRSQGGSNAEMVLGEGFMKHLPGIDWDQAYRAMVNDAEVTPPDQVREGRGGVEDWKRWGLLSIQSVDRPGTKQMEYAADDFELALVARGMGHEADAQKYWKRSENWRNLWDARFQDGGVSGFIRPRNRDGSWKKDFNPFAYSSWGSDSFYEGNSWMYSEFVPQDVKGLIAVSGGPEAFVRRLDALFAVPGRYDFTNEPGFLIPYLYIWAGRQDKTAALVRAMLAQNYRATPSGLPGNDDAGAMSSWYVFGILGIFPNAGQDVYLIGSPSLPRVTLHLAGDKSFAIEAQNASSANVYVQSAMLNGKPWNKAWLRHADILAGGKLTLTMGPKPGAWPTGEAPPSSSDTPFAPAKNVPKAARGPLP